MKNTNQNILIYEINYKKVVHDPIQDPIQDHNNPLDPLKSQIPLNKIIVLQQVLKIKQILYQNEATIIIFKLVMGDQNIKKAKKQTTKEVKKILKKIKKKKLKIKRKRKNNQNIKNKFILIYKKNIK